MIKHSLLILCCSLLTLLCQPVCQAQVLQIGNFSDNKDNDSLFEKWHSLKFDNIAKLTKYTLIHQNGTNVVQAVSQSSASGLYREIHIDPEHFPLIQWRWQVKNILGSGNALTQQGDDYAARIYITFKYDVSRLGLLERIKYESFRLIYGRYPPLAVINYIWANKLPVGKTVDNAYTKRVKMIAIESGTENLGKWLTETRNVFKDYQQAFGEAPGAITGIAIMTDTDNTGESATSYYGDIQFLSGEQTHE
jgi:hypothetical protein